MRMPALFRRLCSKKIKAQAPAPPAATPNPVVAPMTDQELQMVVAVGVLAITGIVLASFMGKSASSLQDGSMRLLASVANEASAKIEAFKKSSQ